VKNGVWLNENLSWETTGIFLATTLGKDRIIIVSHTFSL